MDTIFTLCNDRQNRRNVINPTNENTIACNEANASIVNCSTSGAVAPVVSRRATTTTTLSTTFSSAKPTFSSAKLIVKKLSIVHCALLIAFCFLFAGNAWADELTVYDGTATSSTIPMYGLYFDDYTKSECIIPSTELEDMTGGTITAMTFYVSSANTGAWDNTNQKVFLKEVSGTTLGGSYSGMTDATIVFDGRLTMPTTTGAYTINFSTNYTYNGGNLLIGVYNDDDGTYHGISWYGVSELTSGVSAYGYNASSLASATYNEQQFLPKTTFTYTLPVASFPLKIVASNPAADEMTWAQFADNVNNGRTYEGYIVRLMEDISVSTMVGTYTTNPEAYKPFSGTFDGQGHTLNVSYNNTGSTQISAPFKCISGATIRNLHITGSITTQHMRPASITGIVVDNSTIKNCWSEVAITSSHSSDIDCGSFVARVNQNKTVTIEGCAFTGSITYSNSGGYEGGGMVGWTQNNATAILNNCLFAPTAISTIKNEGHYTFVGGYTHGTLTNCYYNDVAAAASLTMTSSEKQAYSVTGVSGTTVAMRGNNTASYDVSHIDVYSAGIVFNGTVYGGSGETLSLNLGTSTGESVFDYSASSGTLTGTATTGTDDAYTLAMPSANVEISAHLCETITSFPWTEDFNNLTVANSIPSCWDNSDGTTTGDSYKWSYNTSTSGNGATNGTSHDGSKCVRFNSYTNSSGKTNMLKTPVMNFPAGSVMQLSFWYKNPTGDDFSVYISTDGGATYTTSLATGLTAQSSWTQKVITLNSYVGTQNVVIVFKGTSNYGSGDAYIYLDDVSITETPKTYIAEWVSAEVGDASSWCIGETRTVTLQIKNTGTATWYNSTANGGDYSQTHTNHDMVAVSYHWDEDYDKDGHISYDMHNNRNHFPNNVAPGETATISFDVVGPRMKGANHLKFAMIRQECCWFYDPNNGDCSSSSPREWVVDVTVPDFTLAASNTVICNGGESDLSTNCDLTGNIYTSEPYIWDWNISSYTSSGNAPTHIGSPTVSGSIIRFTTAGNDPSIDMYNLGSFDPTIYKYVRMRYRITEGTGGSVQIFYQSTTGANSSGANGSYYKNGTLVSDGQWHIVQVDMYEHNLWTSNGNIKGWRLDPCTASGVKMEIDWIGLFPDAIETNTSSLTVNPTQTTTYYACNYVTDRPYIHKVAQTVTVADQNIAISSSPASTECLASKTKVTLTASAPFTYSWTRTGTNGTASGTGNGTYTVSPTALTNTYTASITNSGCTAQVSRTVTTKPTITASSSAGNSDACDGSDVLLSAASNATDFVWSNNAGTDPVVTVHPRSSTTYYVTASSATCTNSASISVNVKTSPTITASPDIASTCFDGSSQVVLTAGGAAPTPVALEQYEFSTGTDASKWYTVTNTTSSLVSPGVGDYGTSGVYNIGFTFNMGGTNYTQYSVNSDGYVRLGGTNIGTDYYNQPFGSNLSNDLPKILAYGRDGALMSSDFVYAQVFGNEPNRVLVLDIKTHPYDVRSTDNAAVRYQVQLHETTNEITFVYAAAPGTYSSTGNQIGIASTASDFITVNSSTHEASHRTSSFADLNTASVWPGQNRYYSFAPPISYDWTYSGTSGTASGTTYTVTPSEGTNTYTVSVEGCSRSITIDVLTANNITASGLTTNCGVPVTLSASGIEGATYDWYDGNTLVQANSSSFTPTDIIYGKTYNVKVSKEIYGTISEDPHTFSYTGTVQSVTIPEGAVAAKLEVWGAQGGGQPFVTNSQAGVGGKGGYSVGTMSLQGNETLRVYVGGHGGSTGDGTGRGEGGWNGGGCTYTSSSGDPANGGGGATDIRLNGTTYYDRIIVAGGGGGGGEDAEQGGYGGGLSGSGSYSASQTSAGNGGVFGAGAHTDRDGGGAGGGWYGGGATNGSQTIPNSDTNADNNAGSGGSGYVWTSATASSAPSGYNVSSSYYLSDAETIAGNATMPNPDGGTMTGREGHGYARITFYVQNHITCTSQPKQVALTVTPLTPPSAQDLTICPDNTASFSVDPAVSGYTYHWQSESGSDTGTGNSFTTASLDNTTTYQITATKAFDRIVAAYDFDYIGEMQEVVAPSDADYAILEVWGAEGGSSRADGEIYPLGGKGGYAKGKMEVSSGQHFYVVVGGRGQDAVLGPGAAVITAKGGYNGGGGGTSDAEGTNKPLREASGGGGGATHIAKAAPSSGTDYQLYYYSSNQDDVLLVAGGGGGACYKTRTGGYGGGTAGGRSNSGGLGGTQTARASSGTQIAGIFGRGANGSGAGKDVGVAGGGGGWYGGNVNTITGSSYNSGGGGSGHINSTQLTNTSILAGNNASIPNIAGTGTETGHSGNGHARIVFYSNGGGECVSQASSVNAFVNTPSVGTLTFTTDQNICPGTAVTLQVTSVNPTASEGLSYVWKKGSTTISGATTNTLADITAEATYNVNVTATNILNGKTCTANQSQDIAVTYKTPSADERTELGIADKYYVWTGYSSDWTEINNWMKYTSSSGKYTLTGALPASNINVVIGKYSTCVSENPVLNIDDAANTNILKVGTGVTISGSSTLTVASTLTNKGTINGSLAMSVSGAVNNSGTINSSLTLNGSSKNLTNNGTLNAPAVFNGVTTLAGSGSTTFSSVTINLGKTLKTSSHNITISGDCTNNGTLTAGAGSITMTGNLANNGIFTASTGAITMTGNLTNSGTFNGAGGTISITGNLTNTSAFKTAAGALSLNGNLTNSGTFTIGDAGAVTLTGNWTNNGTFTPTGAGAVIFAGTSSQVIGGSNATTFKNVQFNNSANSLSISNEPTITGTATFSSGVVTGNITLGNVAIVSGASTSSYVNGKVTKIMKANATFTFPIGTASLYAPFEAKSSAASNVSVQYASGSEDMPDVWNHSGNFSNVGLDHASDRENWQVSASATTNLSAIKLYWNTAAGNYHSFEEGADALASYLRIAAVKKNGFYWQNLGQSAIEGDFDGAGSITAATPLAITVGAKAAGDDDYFVTFASTNKGNLLLPIELTSFTATCDGRSTLVEWTTASERNNDYFVIERSDDAMNFTEVGRVAGAGNSIEQLDYTYNDYGIHGGDNYYRLVQVDYDGSRSVSEIVVATCEDADVEEPDVQAFPNPFNGELTLVLDNFDNRPATIEVYDMLGKLIYIQKADAPLNSYETILNLSNLPSGAYNVRVSTADFVINRQVVKN